MLRNTTEYNKVNALKSPAR